MRVLGVCSYPIEAAATRFRLDQYVEPLREHGIKLTVRPFLGSAEFRQLYRKSGFSKLLFPTARSVFRRFRDVLESGSYDLLYVQREAMPFGPGFFEWIYQTVGRLPTVLDLDDATYIPYESPTYGKLGSYLKFFSKTNRLIDRADLVISGNRFIAKHVESRGSDTVVIPTIVDTDVFTPAAKGNEVPVMGWIGTHSTFPFLERIFPILHELAGKFRFRLKIVGSGRPAVDIPGIEIENLEWRLDREVIDFQTLDIGLYPISVSSSANDDWLAGKSGFKAIQYMSVGVPSVISPVGVCGEIGEAGATHLNAATDKDWYNHLDKLLSEPEVRVRMGQSARRYAEEHFSLPKHAVILANTLRSVRGKHTSS